MLDPCGHADNLVGQLDHIATARPVGRQHQVELLVKRLARIESLTEVSEFPKGTATIAAEGTTFGLPLAGIIDVAEERARLEKSLEKLAKEIGGMEGRLKNPKFVESAPEEVVEETRELAAQKSEEAAILKAALQRLAEIG